MITATSPSLEMTVRMPPKYSVSEVRNDQREILYCRSLIACRHYSNRMTLGQSTLDPDEMRDYGKMLWRWTRVRDSVTRLLHGAGRTF